MRWWLGKWDKHMKLVTCEQMRELDRKTISEFEIPGEVLMDRAGLGVADVVQNLARMSGCADAAVRLFAGRGNNGGDAFVAARYLKERGFDIDVWVVGKPDAISGDALKHFDRMRSAGIALRELPVKEDWDDMPESCSGAGGILVDGLLGTGISGPVRGSAAGAIRHINALGHRNLVVAIDVPSGLNTDTGEPEGEAVVADITVTMGLPKCGLAEPCAMDFVGTVEVVDIGIPEELLNRVESDRELITGKDLRSLMKRRSRNSHKGTFGNVLLIGGAAGYTGAIAMAARAAARSGAGLVTALVPSGIAAVVAGISPESMVHCAPETDTGSLSSDCLAKWNRNVNDFDAILMGPGMTTHKQTRLLVERVIDESRVPIVIDADALNAYEGRINIIKRSSCPIIITPHPGEMARLLGCSVADVQADRFKAALSTAEDTNTVTVLKGSGTIVASKGRPPNINMTGNPGMATGGMGDILGGLVAGLVAQGFEPFDAARIGVYLHGRAGDNVAWRSSQAGMIASDVIEELPSVFMELAIR